MTEPTREELIEALEEMARQYCYLDPNSAETDSAALSANVQAMDVLARLGRFRIVRRYGRRVIGYWPEDDPERPR